MEQLNAFGLAANPFPLVPGARVTNWAGLDEIRSRLEDVVHSVLVTDTGLSEFVIVHGSYGAGKTHALRYLATLVNETAAAEYKSLAVYIPKIRVGPKLSFVGIYLQIFQEIGADRIRHFANEIKQRVDVAANALAFAMDRVKEKELRDLDPLHFEKAVVSGIPAEDRPMVRLLLDLAKGQDQVLTFMLEGKPVVQGSDFSQPVTTDFMAATVLSSLIRVLTLQIGEQEPICLGFHLFIDEVEEAIEAKATEQLDLWQAIRELVNRLPYNFAFLLAFSAEAALLEAIMPTALAERTSRQNIELHALSLDEAKQFIRNQLSSYRPEGYVPPHPYYPFSEDAVDYLLEQTVIPVPRKIFRTLRTVLERAIRREGLQPGEEIDAGMAEEIVLAAGL